MVSAEHRVGDAINEPRMLPNQSLDRFLSAAIVCAALCRCHSAQDRLYRQHAFALTHEDRPDPNCVQEFLERERAGWAGLRAGEVRHAGAVIKERLSEGGWSQRNGC